jgi:hypothetical protein
MRRHMLQRVVIQLGRAAEITLKLRFCIKITSHEMWWTFIADWVDPVETEFV